MEILLAEADKRLVKWSLYLLRKKLGEQASVKAIQDDMKNCGNLGIKVINDIVLDTTSFVKCDHQKNIIIDLTQLGLWICYKDTGYRDIFFYLLDEILKRADEIRELIKPFVKPPEQWHVNVWIDSKNLTSEQVEKGEILKGSVSFAESVHVREFQNQRLSKIASSGDGVKRIRRK